jgi:hypothetical protein
MTRMGCEAARAEQSRITRPLRRTALICFTALLLVTDM